MEVGKFNDSRISKNFKNLDELMKLNQMMYEAYSQYIEFLNSLLSSENRLRETIEIRAKLDEMLRQREHFKFDSSVFEGVDHLLENIIISTVIQEQDVQNINQDLVNDEVKNNFQSVHDDRIHGSYAKVLKK